MIDWQTVAFGILAIANGGAGYMLKRLIEQVDKLTTCVAKQNEWRSQHDQRHAETRQDVKDNIDDAWVAINELRRRS